MKLIWRRLLKNKLADSNLIPNKYALKDIYSSTDEAYPTLFPDLLIQLADVFEDE